jgi:membrane-associated protease RseP (regulator of RpoE activity)
MKAHGKGLTIISLCLLLLFLGCHRKPPPPDYENQTNCQLKKGKIGLSFDFKDSKPEVLKVMPDSAAAKADIRPGDIFVSVNQSTVNTRADFKAIMSRITTETPISIVVKRNSEYITKTIVPRIVGEFYVIDAIDSLLENKTVNLIIIVNEITNTYSENPNYSQLAEWKKGMVVRLRSHVETGLIRRYPNAPNFSVVARENTEKLIQELSIQQSGLVTELIKAGKIIGATHLLVMDLNRSRTPDWSTLDTTSRRLIDIETGKTIASESCQRIFW